jgi:hypothetical protein
MLVIRRIFFFYLLSNSLPEMTSIKESSNYSFFWGCHLLVHTNVRSACRTLVGSYGDDTKCSPSFC